MREAKRSPTGDAVHGIEVIRAGMFTTVQDLGRSGHRAQGVVLSGAADAFALRLANLVVGNGENTAGLEFTLVGPELKFLHDTLVALGGADFGVLPRWRPVRIRAGTQLKFGMARSGYRGYLAFAGGLDVAPVLGSRSTYVRAGLGGLAGRPLRDGDILPVPDVPRLLGDHWRIDERIVPPYSNEPTIRVMRGAQADEYGAEFFSARYTVTPQADRMGVRLRGPALARSSTHDLLSSPVAPGTVQVPPDGQPIVLLADAQTIGGYPQIAHVIAVDLPLIAQLRPGDPLRIREVSLEEAHQVAVAREHAIAILREGLAQKFG
jgi:antagonist of KipI